MDVAGAAGLESAFTSYASIVWSTSQTFASRSTDGPPLSPPVDVREEQVRECESCVFEIISYSICVQILFGKITA